MLIAQILSWVSFLEMIEVLLMHYHTLRTKHWEEFLCSVRFMLTWMAIYNNLHYTRCMSIYWTQMNNLDVEMNTYMADGLFSFSMIGLPFSDIPHDQWIEMTMNKGLKVKRGWVGFTKNESMVNIHTSSEQYDENKGSAAQARLLKDCETRSCSKHKTSHEK